MSDTHSADLESFFDALARKDFRTLEASMDEDVVFEFPGKRFGGRIEGRDRVMTFLKQTQRMFRDGLRFQVEWSGVAGDRGIVQWRNRGTTRDGRAYENRGVTVFRLRGERIVEIHDYLDTERVAQTFPPSRA